MIELILFLGIWNVVLLAGITVGIVWLIRNHHASPLPLTVSKELLHLVESCRAAENESRDMMAKVMGSLNLLDVANRETERAAEKMTASAKKIEAVVSDQSKF